MKLVFRLFLLLLCGLFPTVPLWAETDLYLRARAYSGNYDPYDDDRVPVWSLRLHSTLVLPCHVEGKGRWFKTPTTQSLTRPQCEELLGLAKRVRADIQQGRLSDQKHDRVDAMRYVVTIDRQEVQLWLEAPKTCDILKDGNLKCQNNTLSSGHQLLLKLVEYVHQMRPKGQYLEGE